MPVVFKWDDDDQTIARFIIEAPLHSWDDYHEVVNLHCRKIEKLSHTVHLIFDTPTDVPMPPGNPIAEIKRTYSLFPKNAGVTCSIIAQGIARRVLSVTLKIILTNHTIVPDLETAYALIDAYKANSNKTELD